MNSKISLYNLEDNGASEVKGVRVNDRYGALSKRSPMKLSYSVGSSAAITGLHRYYRSDSTQKLITTSSTFIYVGDDDAGTVQTIGTGFTDGSRWTFVTYNDVLIGTNADEQPIKYDGKTTITANTNGARSAGYVVADLCAPFVELNTGTVLTAARWYRYMITFYDGTTYEYSTAKSNPILTGAAVYSLYLTGIPLGPSGTTNRYIFRTPAHTSVANVLAEADADYLMVKDLADNTTTVWADTVADAAEPDSPNWATVVAGTDATPPTGNYGLLHQQRYFLSGDTTATQESYLYWSDPYLPNYFDSVNGIEKIRPDDGDEITGINAQLGVLAVFKKNSIQNFYTNSTSDADWYIGNSYTDEGCIAPYSIDLTIKGIAYLSHNGLFLFTGQSSHLFSDAVMPEIEDILETAMNNVAGIYWKNEYLLAYTSKATGAAANDRVLIYDFVRDAYTMDHKTINCWTAFDGGTDFGILYSGDSSTSASIYAHESAPNILIKRYKSEFDAGTFNDARSQGTENSPIIEMSWDCTIDGWLAELQTKNASINTIDDIGTYLPNAIIDRPDTDGTWVSEIYRVNASAFDKLYWHERLSVGDITWQLRTDDNVGFSSPSAYSTAVSIPSGSDISSITAEDYVQFRTNLSTTDIVFTPELFYKDGYLFQMTYSKKGQSTEGAYLSSWSGGWEDFGVPGRKKQLVRIKVFYIGDSGTLTIGYKNEEGDIDTEFSLDMSIVPPFETVEENKYTGVDGEKIFTFYCPSNENGEIPESEFWQFSINETGNRSWIISRIAVLFESKNIYD